MTRARKELYILHITVDSNRQAGYSGVFILILKQYQGFFLLIDLLVYSFCNRHVSSEIPVHLLEVQVRKTMRSCFTMRILSFGEIFPFLLID
jgi:hypothetical protein